MEERVRLLVGSIGEMNEKVGQAALGDHVAL
jgi:hypothetical protein